MSDREPSAFRVDRESDIVAVRQAVRELAREIEVDLVSQTKLVTATSELARNLLEHGGGGAVDVRVLREARRVGVEVIFTDEGPGIGNVEQALTDGFTSGRGLGLGLGGSRRLVHDFELETEVGEGTRIRIVRWSR